MTTDAPAIDSAGGFSVDELVADYPFALVRIASLRADSEHHLLFGWVELYPFDMRVPKGWKAGKKPWSVPGKSGWSCGFSATRVPTKAALQWYGRAKTGNVNIAIAAAASVDAKVLDLAPEPTWGYFAASVAAPFATRWHNGPRIHRLVPMQRPPRAVCELGRIPQARHWLADSLGFDVFAHEEWLCGLALLAPDPVCTAFQIFRSARALNGIETITIQMVPRRATDRVADLSTLTVHVAERRSSAWSSVKSMTMSQDGVAHLHFPQPTDQIAGAVVCKNRGIIRAWEPHPWLNQIGIDFAVSGGQIEVEVPAGGRRKPAQTYQVAQNTSIESSVVGGPIDDRARTRLIRSVGRREERERRVAAPQKIFGLISSASVANAADVEAKKLEAQEFIAALASQARRRLIFVDPFFGPREVRLFALRNSHPTVVPHILTGLPALKALVGGPQGFQRQQGLSFVQDLKHIETKLGHRTPLVRVMPGQDQPIIHDRYLVVDEAVWHCGPSFNELGERLGVIVRLPNALDIRVMIGRVWRQSTPLEQSTPSEISEADARMG